MEGARTDVLPRLPTSKQSHKTALFICPSQALQIHQPTPWLSRSQTHRQIALATASVVALDHTSDMQVSQYSLPPTGDNQSLGFSMPTTTYQGLDTTDPDFTSQISDCGIVGPDGHSSNRSWRPQDFLSIKYPDSSVFKPSVQSDHSVGNQSRHNAFTQEEVQRMFAFYDASLDGDNQRDPEVMEIESQFPQEQLSIDQSSHPSPITPKNEKKDGQIYTQVSQPHKSLGDDLRNKATSQGENRTERLRCTVCDKGKVKCVYTSTRTRCQKCYAEHKKCTPILV
jgi:hypothetical protein